MIKSIVLCLALLFCINEAVHAQVSITLDSTTKFQTIEGWGHGGDLFSMLNYGLDPSIKDSFNYQTLNYLIDDLGLTGSRIWEVGPRIDGTPTDDGDCDSVDWKKFQVGVLDTTIAKYMVYFKNRVNAEGYQTNFYSSPGYPTHASDAKPWVMYDPGERAQQIWANSLWWKQNYGIDINYDVIYNEPGSPITSAILADDIKALAPRATAHGLVTKTQYAEAVAPETDWGFITPEQNDAALWPLVGRISYHTYGTADPYRSYLHHFADSLGITTAQTEMGNPTIDDIYHDMLFGGTSYWEVAFSGSNTLTNTAGNTGFTPSGTYFRMRQVIHYVRPGMVRIAATSSDSNIHVLSFLKNGKFTTVFENFGADTTITLTGLPPGQYGISQCPSGASAYAELGIKTVGANGTLSFNSGVSGYASTVYPYSGPNHAPDITSWSINPGYLVAPTTAATLSVTANDAELDSLRYNWSVASQPSGANAVIANPTKTSTAVNGLSVAGTYIFAVNVSDGTNISTRKVYVVVYASNPPPMMGQAGFRINQPYGLVFTNPGDTTHANIELPTSTVTTQVGIGDLANDAFDGRGKWTIVSQPPGGVAIVDTTYYIYISIRGTVTGMTVPGDYVFQCNVTNPGHPDLTCRVICTVHAASAGPIINSITATPPNPTLPADSTTLSASTTDTSGQQMRYWWEIKTVPAGANPVFTHQGLAISNVGRLSIPGTYTFTLRAFDDIHETTKDVTVQVGKGSRIFDTVMSLTPSTWNAGSLAAGLSDTATFTIMNRSSGGVTISGNVGTPTDPAFSVISGNGPFTLGEGEQVVFRVRYASDGKLHNADLIVNGANVRDTALLSSGVAISDTAMTLLPAVWDASALTSGLSDTATFTITNKSSVGVTISGNVGNPTDPAFSILSGSGPYTLGNEGGTSVFRVRYLSDGKAHNGNITVTGLRLQDKVVVNLSSEAVTGGADVSAADASEGVMIEPNPVTSELNIQCVTKGSTIVYVTLANLLGQIVRHESTSDNSRVEMTLPMEGLPSGIYLLTIQTKDQIITRKIIKQ
jgi:hypothetical protein